jgi:hypothetical protein
VPLRRSNSRQRRTFGIIGGEFRFDLFVGQLVGACGAFNRRENRSQRIVSRGLGAQQAADEFSDTLTPLPVSERLGRLWGDWDFNHHRIGHFIPRSCPFARLRKAGMPEE